MRLLTVNLTYFYLLLISLSISFQYDYLFFNVPFFIPFLTISAIFFCLISFSSTSLEQIISFFFFITIFLFFILFISFYDQTGLKRTFLILGFIILSVFVISKLLHKISFIDLKKIINITLFFCIISVAIETIVRFKIPTLDLRSDNSEYIVGILNLNPTLKELFVNQYFYAYKFSSIMFFDSNYVALFLLPLLILNLYCLEFFENKKKYIFYLLIIIFLILLTFSRAGIFTSLITIYFYFMYKLMKKNKRLFILSLFFLILFGSISFNFFTNSLLKDGSFITKLNIFSSLKSLFMHDIIHIIFGYGIDAGAKVYSYKEDAYAHALIPLLLGQFGILGTILFFFFFIYYSFKIGFFGWLLFFAIVFSGFSLADPWQVLNYFVLLIMAHIKRCYRQSY